MPSTPKLTYFNVRGRGELIRFLFTYSGKEFEDKTLEFQEWPAFKSKTILGSLPELEIDGVKLVQSLAISRYLANKFGLAGTGLIEQALADGVVATTEDVRTDYVPILFEANEAEKEKKKKAFLEKVQTNLQFFEDILKENKKNGGYFVGKKFTWADFALFDLLGIVGQPFPTLLDKYPEIKAHSERILKDPKIKKFVDERPDSDK